MIATRAFPSPLHAELFYRVLRARRVNTWIAEDGLTVNWVRP